MGYKWQQQIKPKGGFYPETKVYFDGSHYIAIPHTERPYRPRNKPVEEVITVADEKSVDSEKTPTDTVCNEQNNSAPAEKADALIGVENSETPPNMAEAPQKSGVKITKKQLFEQLYKELLFHKKAERREKIIEAMLPYFQDEESAVEYVDRNLERKRRNLIARRIRFTRKANLQEFNYFVTFTYDSALHTEDSFRKKLKSTLGHFCSRKHWCYMGVWEHSPEKKRLHFHGIFNVPDGTMPGKLEPVNSYSFATHRRQITNQNSYFLREFGRNDFKPIEGNGDIYSAMAYIMKYIEKSGEKIVYSKGLSQFFISDIMVKDVVCKIGLEDSKLLLFDNFTCWDEGVKIGTVSPETIAQMRKSN